MFKQLGAAAAFRLEDELQIPSVVNFAPLAIAPIPTPFGERKRPSFPIYGKRKPSAEQGIVPEYEQDTSGGPDYEAVNIEDLPTELESLLGGTGKSGKVDVFGKDFQIGPKGTRATFGVVQAFDPGKALGQVASLSGSFITAGYAGQKNLEQLQYAQAMAGLGKKGYGVGVVNNQVIGVTPSNIIGTIPNASPKDMEKIREMLTGKSGPMAAGIESMKSKFSPTATFTDAEKKFQDEIMNSKLPDEVKAEILGFDPTGRGRYAFSPGRLQAQFGVTTPQSYRQAVSYKDFVKDYTFAARNRAGDVTGLTDVSAPSMGLETDIDAQVSQQNPMGINIGIDMDNITGVDTGVGATGDLGGGYGGPTGGPSGLDASQPSSYNDNNDSDGGMGGGDTSSSNDGFGGGGWTAYGGKIGTSKNGFTSKVEVIRGVGLIKPEQTFMDTDVVDDRFEFDAEDGDYVVNGPASDSKSKQINSLINYAMNELKKEGVDIRVGNPKIKNRDRVPLITASSETYIPRVIAEKIGYPILEAINNSGKSEVTRLKNKLNDEPTDESKYAAYEGMRVRNPEQGFLFRKPPLNTTDSNIGKYKDAFVPGISDQPIEMTLDQERFFGDYTFGDIKKAIKKTEIQGFEKNPYIFTGVKAKKGKSSSAFGPMQITKSLIEDFENRSPEYKTLNNEEKKYLQALKLQGEDKINKELYGVLKRGPAEMRQDVDVRKVYGKKSEELKPYGKGTIDPKMHKKYYDKIADVILLHKLKDHKTIEDALASYGEGAGYGEKVLNDLLDIIQIK